MFPSFGTIFSFQEISITQIDIAIIRTLFAKEQKGKKVLD